MLDTGDAPTAHITSGLYTSFGGRRWSPVARSPARSADADQSPTRPSPQSPFACRRVRAGEEHSTNAAGLPRQPSHYARRRRQPAPAHYRGARTPVEGGLRQRCRRNDCAGRAGFAAARRHPPTEVNGQRFVDRRMKPSRAIAATGQFGMSERKRAQHGEPTAPGSRAWRATPGEPRRYEGRMTHHVKRSQYGEHGWPGVSLTSKTHGSRLKAVWHPRCRAWRA